MRDRKVHFKYDPVVVGRGKLRQTVTPSRNPTAYLTESYTGSSRGYIPVEHKDLDRDFLYNCAIACVKDGKVVGILTDGAGPEAIETIIAKLGHRTDEEHLLCFCAAGEKPVKDKKPEKRHERHLRQKTGVSS
jgi:hypothetical protein